MKSLEKLQKAMENLFAEFADSKNKVVGDAIVAIHEFVIDNTPKKKSELSVWEFVMKDKSYPNMGSVFHDNKDKVAVATNAQILFVNPNEYIDSTEKPADCKQFFDYDGYTGLMRDKYGNAKTYEGKYPRWRGVFPKDTISFEIREDLKKVRDIATSSLKTSDRAGFHICINKELDIWVAGKYVDFVIRAGLDGWRCVEKCPSRRSIVKEWDDGRKMLLMPVMPPECLTEADGYDSMNLVKFY